MTPLGNAFWIWLAGIPVVFVIHALWFRLRGVKPSSSDGAMAMMYSLLWPGAYPLYWFILLYCWTMGRVCAAACWLWNLIALPKS